MAYTLKTKSGYCVKKGNTGETIRCFRGKNAKKKAEDNVKRLHRKHNPKASNRGKRARKREEK